MAFEQLGTEVPAEEGRALGWDDTIEKESTGFITLPEGDYTFKVQEFQRGRHEGSQKLPPCNKAVITLVVETPEGEARIRHNLFLHSRTEGMISAFFISIGLKKHGEPLKMDWQRVIGRTGRVKIGVRTHDGKQYNEVKRFYDPEDTTAPTAAAPQQQALYSGQQQAAPAFRPGAF